MTETGAEDAICTCWLVVLACVASAERCVEALLLIAVAVASAEELDIDCSEESEMADVVLGGRDIVLLTYVAAGGLCIAGT